MIRLRDGFIGERALVVSSAAIEKMDMDPLTSSMYITNIGYFPKARYHFRERYDPVNQYILIYCVDGSGWFSVEGNRRKVEANQLFVIPANVTPHSYGANEHNPWSIYWFHFAGSQVELMLEGLLNVVVEIKSDIGSRFAHRIEIFEEIFRVLENGYSLDNLRYSSIVFSHFLASIRYLRQFRLRNHNSNDLADSDMVGMAIDYMRDNIERHVTLEQIAHHVGYSVSHFSLLFSQSTGHAPLAYLNRMKMQAAAHLLDFSTMQVNQICHKVGIEDPYYFSKLFTKITGHSPRAYRKLTKG